MTPEQFLDALQRLGLKQSDYARLIDVNPKTVWMWASGRTSIPKLASEHLHLLLELDDMHRRFIRGLAQVPAQPPWGSGDDNPDTEPPSRLAAFLQPAGEPTTASDGVQNQG